MEENLNVLGVEAQEPTEPATTATEPVNPTEEAKEGVSATENPTEPSAPTAENAEKSGKTEEDAKYASARRKAEAELAKAREELAQLKDRNRRLNEGFKSYFGKAINPLTGKPIGDEEDATEAYLNAWGEQQRRTLDEKLRANNIDPNTLNSIVENLPVVRKANEVLRAEEQRKEQEFNANAEKYFQEELKAISAMDSSIKTKEDLFNHPSFEEVSKYVKENGLTFSKAFKLANMEALSAKKMEAAEQAAINKVNAKNHMEATGSGHATDSGLVDVPASLAATWKAMDSHLTDADIKAKYNEFLKKTGGK